MRPSMTVLVTVALMSVAADLVAQATGTPTYNAPYRAFTRSEFGALISFPEGGDVALEGAYRMASGRFDIGFKAGFSDPSGPGDVIILAGAEARQRVITHSVDFPLDGALVLGIGGWFQSGNSLLFVPVGLSLGRRLDVQNSSLSIVPYLQPTLFIVGGDVGDHVSFSLGLGADFRFTPRFDGRVAAGLGDLEGVSLSLVWVH